MVDVGEPKPRQIVAGLADYYQPEELVGKIVNVLVNLQPAKLCGVESQGMLLAADAGERVSLLTPDKDMNPGSIVR
jgi:methionyl-tRNA synthetase